jgi:glycosyltransferase involved in cell wall biosynthesis
MTCQFSVLILTLNEEKNLPGALESLWGCDDVVIFDSGSSDRTVEIARTWGARVENRAFDNYAAQRRAGLSLLFRHEWVLMLDADERVTPELMSEMSDAVAKAPPDVCMFRMRRKDMFLGTWLKHSSGYPTWFGRLVRPGRVRIEREVNEEYVPLGEYGNLAQHLEHFPFNRGLDHWVEKHNQYSTMEALQLHRTRRGSSGPSGLFSRDPVLRRKSLKQLAYRLPFRPVVAFLYLYVWRRGFLDGKAGYIYCRLRYIYEELIDLKAMESETQTAIR